MNGAGAKLRGKQGHPEAKRPPSRERWRRAVVFRTKTILGWCAVPLQMAVLVLCAMLAFAGELLAAPYRYLFGKWIGESFAELFANADRWR